MHANTDIDDGMLIKISPIGRAGMKKGTGDPLTGAEASPRRIERPRSPSPGFELQGTPSPKPERITKIPQPRRGGPVSFADRTTMASERESGETQIPRFTNVAELERELQTAREQAAQVPTIQRQLLETQKAVRRLEEERDKLFERTQNLLQDPPEKNRETDKLEPKRKLAQRTRTEENFDLVDEEDEKETPSSVYLGNSPPNLDNLTNASDKPISDRLVVLTVWS